MRIFNIDITRKGISPVVQVTEHDAMSRFFTLILRNGNADYEPPENPSYSVWYKTKDSTGWYDTIEEPDNGTHPAVVASGNMFTIEIAEAATTSCGELALMITGDDGYQLTVTGIITQSADIPGYDSSEVENYYNVYITEMRENAARAENAADIAVAYGATVEVDEDAQQLNITHHSDTEGGVGWLFGSAIMTSAEGSVAAFSDGANDVAVKSLVATINPVQSGSGDPSPTNIRPISGRTGMTVKRCGRNLLNNTSQTSSASGITWTINSDGTVTANGTATADSQFIISIGADDLPRETNLYFSGCPGGGSSNKYNAYIWDNTANARAKKWDNINPVDTDTGATTNNELYLTTGHQYSFNMRVMSGQSVSNIVFKPMVRMAGASGTFEPYAGQTYPLTWQTEAGTVYGGTLDVVSGVLTVDREYIQFTDDKWTIWNDTDKAAFTNADYSGQTVIMCDSLVPNSNGLYVRVADGRVRAIAPWAASCTSLEEFKTAIADNPPINAVLTLATPTTYQLTPTEVKTLLGGNTIYTDAGSVSVEYVADTKLYIDNKVAELQALILEN